MLLVAGAIWIALPAEWSELRWPFVAILVTFVATFPLRIYHAALQGLQDLAYLGRVQLVAWVAGTALTVSLVFGGVGLSALVAGWIVTQLVTAAACGWRLRRHFAHGWMTTAPRVPWPEARTMLGRSAWVSLAQVAQVFLNGTDVLIIGKLLGPAAVVPYSCTGKLVTRVDEPSVSADAGGLARAQRDADGRAPRAAGGGDDGADARDVDPERRGRHASSSRRTRASSHGGSARDSSAGWWLTLALVAAMLLRHVNTTAVYTLFAFGHERRISLTSLGDGAVTLVSSALLVWRYGLIGAPIGSILGVALVGLPANFLALSRETGATPSRIVWELRGWAVRFTIAVDRVPDHRPLHSACELLAAGGDRRAGGHRLRRLDAAARARATARRLCTQGGGAVGCMATGAARRPAGNAAVTIIAGRR